MKFVLFALVVASLAFLAQVGSALPIAQPAEAALESGIPATWRGKKYCGQPPGQFKKADTQWVPKNHPCPVDTVVSSSRCISAQQRGVMGADTSLEVARTPIEGV